MLRQPNTIALLSENALNVLSTLLQDKDPNKRQEGVQFLKTAGGGISALINTVLYTPRKSHSKEKAFCKLLKSIFVQFAGGVDMLVFKTPYSGLMDAVANDNILAVERFLEMGANPNFQTQDGRTVLLEASVFDKINLSIFQALLEAGADPNQKPGNGLYPLINLAGMPNDDGLQRIKMLLKNRRTNVNIRMDDTHASALYNAAISGNSSTLEALINAKADISAVTNRNETALTGAVHGQHIDCVRILLKAGADPNIKCGDLVEGKFVNEESPLYKAVYAMAHETDKNKKAKLKKLVKLLLRNGADPLQICHNEASPLALAIRLSCTETLECFFEEKSINWELTCAARGRSPFIYACVERKQKAIELLLARKVNLNLLDDDHCSALHYAAYFGDLELVKKVFSPNLVNLQERTTHATPLMCASQNGHLPVVEFLLAHGADATLVGIDKRTALGSAIVNQHKEIALRLIPHSNVNHQTHDGATAIFLAAQDGHLDIVKALCVAGGDPKITRDDKQTPLYIAYLYGHHAIVQYLLNRCYFDTMQEDSMEVEFELVSKMMVGTNRVELLFAPKFKPSFFQDAASIQPDATIENELDEASEDNFIDADVQSTFDFLEENGFPQAEIEALQTKWQKKHKNKSEPASTSCSEKISWMEGAVTTDSNDVKLIENHFNGKPCYLYLAKPELIAQGCDILDEIEISRCRFAVKNHATGILKLRGKPIKIDVQHDNQTSKQETLTDEIKVEGKARVLCYRVNSDDNKSVLFVGCVFAPNGLHQTSDRHRLPNKIALSFPCNSALNRRHKQI